MNNIVRKPAGEVQAASEMAASDSLLASVGGVARRVPADAVGRFIKALPSFDTIAAMAASGDLQDGDYVTVSDGANSEPETFLIDTASTTTADGALIVALTGVTSRAISLRTEYGTVAALLADRRTFDAGTILTAEGCRYEAVASGGDLTLAGGQEVNVLPGADGRYAASAFGNTWAALVAAINAEKPLTITAEYTATATTITGKQVDLKFTQSAKLNFAAADADDLTFDGCAGQITDYRATHTGDLGGGSFSGLLLYRCDGLSVKGYEVTGAKDVPIRIFDCDNTYAAFGLTLGEDATRPFCAGTVACSRNSGFYFCRATFVNFGFLILGAGYKSGGYTPPRTFLNEQGMFVRDSYVKDHEGHAYDINGAVGAVISRCVSEGYTGTSLQGSFQIKNSTNIGGEIADGTRASMIENCISIDGSIGFSGQATRGVIFRGNIAIGSQTYGMYLNDCDEAVVDGITIEDWGSNPAAASPLNSETKFAAVSVASTSADVSLRDIQIKQRDVTNAANMRQVYLGGAGAVLSGLKVHRLTSEPNVAEGLVIDGASANIGSDVVPRWATALLIDNAQTSQYAMAYGKTITISGGLSHTFDLSPQRGMTVGSVRAYIVSGTVSDHVYQVGRVGDNDSVLSSRTVATENVKPDASLLSPGVPIQAFANTSGGTVTLNIVLAGVPVL